MRKTPPSTRARFLFKAVKWYHDPSRPSPPQSTNPPNFVSSSTSLSSLKTIRRFASTSGWPFHRATGMFPSENCFTRHRAVVNFPKSIRDASDGKLPPFLLMRPEDLNGSVRPNLLPMVVIEYLFRASPSLLSSLVSFCRSSLFAVALFFHLDLISWYSECSFSTLPFVGWRG